MLKFRKTQKNLIAFQAYQATSDTLDVSDARALKVFELVECLLERAIRCLFVVRQALAI